jgi:small-conductance mechanosensitive channel
VLLARAVFGPGVSLSLYALAAAAIAQELIVPILEPLPIASRLILIAQCGGLAVALGLDLKRGRFASAFPGLPAASVRWVIAAIIGVLVLAVLATIVGQIGAARVMRSVVLGALDLLLVLAVAAGLLFGIFLALMHTSAGQSLRIVREYQNDLGRFSRNALLLLAGVAWISGVVFLLGFGDDASRLGGALHNAEIKIGSISIQMVAVWAGLAVILVTILVVKVVSPLLEVEVLPRFTRKQGLPFAVATVSRYVIVTAGVLLAMAAMGADLTKVSLLAGALGVGIGFGLQGVVNNFVSGLILLLERPVSVGDIIEMGQLSGVVERIGVRSSTVRTPQGAEVILPNADLISKEVTNWTLSDRKKLVEIDIDIAEWSEPEKVVSLLQAAAGDVPGVMASPPPVATFSGGSTGALVFRLEAWVDDYARGRTIESAMRMAVVKKLAEARIGIPAPAPAPVEG